jgi:choline dehydrogenase-like flavoprotein
LVSTIFGLENTEKKIEKYSVIKHDVLENDVDVCVVGSGAAGAIIAEKLASHGRSVVLIEKGGYYDSEDMNQREVDMMPLLWKNGGANFTDNLRIVIAQGQCLGGSTVINDAVCFKTPSIVREQWRQTGVNISDQQWDVAIEEVWREINVSTARDEELNQNNLTLKKACEIKGYISRPNDRNCKDCMRCGFCHLGCHYQTKQDMLVTYIHSALENRNSNINIYCNCSAEKITFSTGNGISVADGVDGNFVDSSGAVKFRIRVNAKVVVLSAGAIASSQILLKNRIAEGKAGRGLSLHPAPFLLGKFENKINAYNGIPMAYACHQFGVTNGVNEGGFLIESIFLPIFQFSLGLSSFLAQHEQLMQDFTYYTMAGLLIRDDSNGTISLTESGHPKIHYDLSPKDINTIAKGLQVLSEMWFDVGAQHVITGHQDIPRLNSKNDIPQFIKAVQTNPDGLQIASAHPQGGNRMGEDSTKCVVDSKCKLHAFTNLYVCDASVFPTSLGVNPQITVMALAAMTADYINKIWDPNYARMRTTEKLGETCSIKQPMYCASDRLDTMFNETENQRPIETLINADDNSAPDKRWLFDKKTLTIYNNKYWKGFFPTDQNLSLVRQFGGFWKRFKKEGGILKGTTHPFDEPIYADNLPQIQKYPGFRDVVYLKYTGIEYALFYDFLKIVDDDTILGKAFFGVPPFGNQMLIFSMSRRYSVDFMTMEDHESIFQEHALAPISADQVMGRWNGKLVSDDALTPVTQVFTYTKDSIGKLQMEYEFGGLLHGISKITLTPTQMDMYDFANWHDEVKIVTQDFMLGKWCSPWSQIALDFAPGFLSVEKGDQGSRICLRYTLSRG